LVIGMQSAYTPDATALDDFRCFLVDFRITQERYVTAFQMVPGNAEIVHHAATVLYSGGDREKIAAYDEQTPGEGWPCFSSHVPEEVGATMTNLLSAWAPGAPPVISHPGTGVRLEPGVVGVMRLHYHFHEGEIPGPDQTFLQLKFARTASNASMHNVYSFPLDSYDLNIPPNHTLAVDRTLPMSGWMGNFFFPDGDAYLVGLAGHMHLLGTNFQMEVISEQGRTVVLDIPRWDFNWQTYYQLKAPFKIRASDRVHIHCDYDNTAEHRQQVHFEGPMDWVNFGEGSQDEMCEAIISIVDNIPGTP
jgi:hypothetical protein